MKRTTTETRAARDRLARRYLDDRSRDAQAMLRDPIGWTARHLVDSAYDSADRELQFGHLWRQSAVAPPSILDEFKDERFQTLVSESPSSPNMPVEDVEHSRRRRITKDEADVRARKILKAEPFLTSRELAAKIPCAHGLVSKLDAWRVVLDARTTGRKPRVLVRDPYLMNTGSRPGSALDVPDTLEALLAEQEMDMAEEADRPKPRRRRSG